MSRSIYKKGDQVLFGGNWYTIKEVYKNNKHSFYYELVNYDCFLSEQEMLDRVMDVKKKPIEYKQMKLF